MYDYFPRSLTYVLQKLGPTHRFDMLSHTRTMCYELDSMQKGGGKTRTVITKKDSSGKLWVRKWPEDEIIILATLPKLSVQNNLLW